MFILLNDGTKVEFTGMNGDNYISETELDTDIFSDDNLSKFTVTDNDGNEETYENYGFTQQMKWKDGTYYICFHEKSAIELFKDKVEKQIVELQHEIEEEEGLITALSEKVDNLAMTQDNEETIVP